MTSAPDHDTGQPDQRTPLMVLGSARLMGMAHPSTEEDSVESRRQILTYMAGAFALPIPAWLADAVSTRTPVYATTPDVRSALTQAGDRADFLAHHYVLPGTDTLPVLEEATALWRDATRMRGELTGAQGHLTGAALLVESKAAILVAHIMMERGGVDAGSRWFKRAHDAGIIAAQPAGLELAGRALLLELADLNTAAVNPLRAEEVASRAWELTRSVNGTSRAMAASVVGRARAYKVDRPGSASAMDQARQWAEVGCAPDEPASLFTYTPHHHHYVAAAVTAHLGDVGQSIEHRIAYLGGGANPGFMNRIILDLGQAPNVARRDGYGAAASWASTVIEGIPANRRSAPVRDHATRITADLEAVTREGGYPAEVVRLRELVDGMAGHDYLATAA